MNDLAVVVPSRGRPGNVRRLIQAWKDTGASAELAVCVDDDDPCLERYPLSGMSVLACGPREGLAGTLNRHAAIYADTHRYVGFMGDDHVPRSPGWDKTVVAALDEMGTGIVYGNDLYQGAALPTAVFLTSDIVSTLGYMCPPGLKHMFLDNTWLAWGQGIDRIRYLPDVVIEHVHPHAGKTGIDAGYQEVWPLMDADREAFRRYMAEQYPADIAKLEVLL